MPLVRRTRETLPSVEPSPIRTGYQSGRGATADVFGADVGRAVSGLGQAIEGVSDTGSRIVANQLAEDNARYVKELDNQFSARRDELGFAEGGFYTQRGRDAVNAAAAYKEAVAKTRDEILAQAPNDAVRRQLSLVLNENLASEYKVADRYTAKEREVANVAASAARIKEAVDYAAAAWDSPDVLAEQEAIIRSEALDQARMQGLDPEVALSQAQEQVTDMYSQAIIASMKTGSTAQAKEMLERYQSKMDAPDAAKLQKLVTDADRVAQDRAESRAYRETIRAERLERLARNEASAELHRRIFSGEQMDTLAFTEPELFAMVSSDGSIMSSLARAEEAFVEGRNFAKHTDPGMKDIIWGLTDQELAEWNDEEARMVLNQEDYSKYQNMKRAAREALTPDDNPTTASIYNYAKSVLRDKAPIDIEWGSRDQSEENRKIQQTMVNEMQAFIASYAASFGSPPTLEIINTQADFLVAPVIQREREETSWLADIFNNEGDVVGYAAQIRDMTPEQRKEVRIAIEDVNSSTVAEVRSLFAQNGQPLPSDQLVEEYIGAAVVRDFRRMQQLLGL